MISNQTIQNAINEVFELTKTQFAVADTFGTVLAKTGDAIQTDRADIESFAKSEALLKEQDGAVYIKIIDELEPIFVLIAKDGDDPMLIGKLTAVQLKNLVIAYKERMDHNAFFQNLLLDNMLLVDMYSRAKKLHIDAYLPRCVFVIEPVGKRDVNMLEIVKELFYTQSGDYVTAIDEEHIVVIKTLETAEDMETIDETARMLVDMAGSEVMQKVKVAYGNIAEEIKGISKAYKEAMMALDVGKIFYMEKSIIAYNSHGIGRLIYQLPINLCQMFVKEIFGDEIPTEIDDEILTTANKFFENSLNVSETSRQLCMHRNTLLYRIEKLQKATGLDIRVFDDALTLKIALMVVNYMRFIEEKEEY